MTFTFAKSDARFVSTASNSLIAEREFLAARRPLLTGPVGKILGSAAVHWDRTEGVWECVETDWRGNILSTVRCSIATKWIAPAISTVAHIDSAADGGHKSMGMLGKGL